MLYRGYAPKGALPLEDWALNVAGVAAVLVALFPLDGPSFEVFGRSVKWHFVFAVLFFLAIGYVCVFLHMITLQLLKDEALKARLHRIYQWLGTAMIVVPVAILLLHGFIESPEKDFRILLIEIGAIAVFAAYWLIKSYEISRIERQGESELMSRSVRDNG